MITATELKVGNRIKWHGAEVEVFHKSPSTDGGGFFTVGLLEGDEEHFDEFAPEQQLELVHG